jgi:hypothetical protein
VSSRLTSQSLTHLTAMGYLGIVQNCSVCENKGSMCEIKVPDLGMGYRSWDLLDTDAVSKLDT